MVTFSEDITTYISMTITVLLLIILNYIMKKKNKKQLDKIIIVTTLLVMFWLLVSILQMFFVTRYDANPIYFDYVIYISICFLPVAFFFLSLIFAKTKITFNKKYLLLFIIPIISLIVLWTNDFHHLFYKVYSINMNESIFGDYFKIHAAYEYILCAISFFILLKYSIRNAGLFSKQAVLIIIGALAPVVINILASIKIMSTNIYMIPLSYTVTIICLSFATLRFDFLKSTPIALQRVVDRISDSYIILNEDYVVTDYNKTFITTFKIKEEKIRGKDVEALFNEIGIERQLIKNIEKINDSNKTQTPRFYVESINKYFNVEISSIIDKNKFLGILILFKDVTQHIEDMKNLKDNQSILLEKERLATLGQMIGGVAHNLKTPIMSISGATEGLEDLVNEYTKSVSDPEVTVEDHHAIAQDMMNWIIKIRSYNNYMSDIITAVKGQAVSMNENQDETFTIEELLSRVNILMRHELKTALVAINEDVQVDKNTKIHGNINSLVQVVNNLISNSIYAYGPADSIQMASTSGSSFIKGSGSEFGSGKSIGQKITDVSTSRIIDLIIFKKDDNIVISIKDYGCGMTKKVKNKLFKQMITTKGHNGSGLGLFMSYSTIKGNFKGNMNFTSEVGKGTTFNIILPAID